MRDKFDRSAPGFTHQSKIDARDWMISHIHSPKRIFTLPSREGLCAILFRKTWPEVEIIGIERSKRIIMESTLVDRNIIDAFLHTDLKKMISGVSPGTKKIIKGNSFNSQRFGIKSIDYDYGLFDFAYLDFCGLAETFINDVLSFEKFMTEDGIVALTFSIKKNKLDPEQVVRDYGMEIVGVRRYKTASQMILIMAKYPKCDLKSKV